MWFLNVNILSSVAAWFKVVFCFSSYYSGWFYTTLVANKMYMGFKGIYIRLPNDQTWSEGMLLHMGGQHHSMTNKQARVRFMHRGLSRTFQMHGVSQMLSYICQKRLILQQIYTMKKGSNFSVKSAGLTFLNKIIHKWWEQWTKGF